MHETLKRTLSVMLALIVVGAGVGGSAMLGTMGADDRPGHEDNLGRALTNLGLGEGSGLAATTGIIIGIAVGGAAAAGYAYIADDTDVNTSAQDEQVELDIYQSAQNQKATSSVVDTAYGNYLNDTQSIALMEGRNAYVNALENGSSQSVAETQAREAVADYYRTKQENLVRAYQADMDNIEYLRSTAESESGVSDSYVNLTMNVTSPPDHSGHSLNGFTNFSVTYVDDETDTIRGVQWSSSGGGQTYSGSYAPMDNGPIPHKKGADLWGLGVKAPTTDYEYVHAVDFPTYHDRWNRIEDQNNATQERITTFVNQTYDKWEAGLINSSDLVDPYLGAREYSPEDDFQTWSLMSLSSMGLNSPQNLSTFGQMEVVDETTGIVYQGILMSDSNPPSGKFEVNQTYNASNLSGPQFVVTGSQQEELDGNFTIRSMTNSDGRQIDNTTYREVDYQTADLNELDALYSDLAELRNEIEAYERSTSSGGGGALFGGLLDGLGGLGGLGQQIIVLILVGLGGLVVLLSISK